MTVVVVVGGRHDTRISQLFRIERECAVASSHRIGSSLGALTSVGIVVDPG
jgi:hypothetical protein